jgi:hypothetical protein
VLPGPGLLLVLAGLILLASLPGREALRRTGTHARDAGHAGERGASPLRLAFSVGTGLVLIAAGVVWGPWPNLPLGGWPTGMSLILSGLILLGLLVVSYRQVAQRRRTPAP